MLDDLPELVLQHLLRYTESTKWTAACKSIHHAAGDPFSVSPQTRARHLFVRERSGCDCERLEQAFSRVLDWLYADLAVVCELQRMYDATKCLCAKKQLRWVRQAPLWPLQSGRRGHDLLLHAVLARQAHDASGRCAEAAARCGAHKVLKALMQTGNDVLQNPSVLEHACRAQQATIVRFLLSKGAVPSSKALAHAVDAGGLAECARLLLGKARVSDQVLCLAIRRNVCLVDFELMLSTQRLFGDKPGPAVLRLAQAENPALLPLLLRHGGVPDIALLCELT